MERQWRRVLWGEPLWLLLLAPLVLLPGRMAPRAWHPYAIAALFLAWPLRLRLQRRLSVRTPLDWSLALILLWLPVNLWISVDRTASWEAIGYLLFGLTLYVALVNWPPVQRSPQIVAWLIVLAGVGLALIGPTLVLASPTKIPGLPPLPSFWPSLSRIANETVNPNVLGGALVLALFFPMAALLCRDRDRPWSVLLLSALAVALLATTLVLTQSRGALLAVLVAMGAVLALRWPRLWVAVPLLLWGIGLAVRWIGPRLLLELVSETTALSSLDGRLAVWSRALYALEDFRYTGIGIGTFGEVIPVLYPYSGLPTVGLPHAHNLFLQVGVDLGLPGLIAYVALIVNAFVLLAKTLRRPLPPRERSLALGAAGGMVAMLVHGMLDAVTWGNKLAFILWALIALIVVLEKRSQPIEQGAGRSVTG